MKWLAIVFSVCLLMMCIGTGNMPQINNIALVMNDTFDIPKWLTGYSFSNFTMDGNNRRN